MEPHGQSPWYLHEILSFAKASEGYPPVAKSAGASMLHYEKDSATFCAFIHRQSPWSSAQADKIFISSARCLKADVVYAQPLGEILTSRFKYGDNNF
jgi:hypothetical protein